MKEWALTSGKIPPGGACQGKVCLGQCSHSNFKLGVFIPPMYKICEYEVKFTGMTFYLEKVKGRNGHGPK